MAIRKKKLTINFTKTRSWVPIIATISAIKEPLVINSNPCKCKKPGDFIWHL